MPRWRTVDGRAELIKPGHVGIFYQALSFSVAGRSTPRTLVMLPDATVLTAPGDRQGHRRRGRPPRRHNPARRPGRARPRSNEDLSGWLAGARRDLGARRVRHPGWSHDVARTEPVVVLTRTPEDTSTPATLWHARCTAPGCGWTYQ